MPRKIKEPTKAQIVKLYETDRFSTAECAKRLGISRSAFCKRLERHGIATRGLSSANAARYSRQGGFTPEQEQLAYGSLLGDACLHVARKKNHTSRVLMFAHGADQREYLERKKSVMGGSKISTRPEDSNLGKPVSQFAYQNKVALAEMERACLRDGVRTVSDAWLSKLGLEGIAYWYQDDGSLIVPSPRSAVIRFHTNGFTDASVDLLVDLLKRWMPSVSANSTGVRDQRVINCYRYTDVLAFLTKIEPYVVPCLKYKVRICQQ